MCTDIVIPHCNGDRLTTEQDGKPSSTTTATATVTTATATATATVTTATVPVRVAAPIGFVEAFLLPNVLSYAIAFGFFKLVCVCMCVYVWVHVYVYVCMCGVILTTLLGDKDIKYVH